MIEYTNKQDGNDVLACFTSGSFIIEVPITGLTDETEIQNKLSYALEQAQNMDWGE